MKFQNPFAVFSGLAMAVHGGFVIQTDQATPTARTSFSNDAESIRYWRSVELAALSNIATWLTAQPTSFQYALDTMNADIEEFVATATYSIPRAVTNPLTVATYTTAPEWYSALPSEVRSVKAELDDAVKKAYEKAIEDAASGGSGFGVGSAVVVVVAVAGAMLLL